MEPLSPSIHQGRMKEISDSIRLLATDTEIHIEHTQNGMILTELLMAFNLDISDVGLFFFFETRKRELATLSERGCKLKEEIRLFLLFALASETDQTNHKFINSNLSPIICVLDRLIDNMKMSVRFITSFTGGLKLMETFK